MKYYYGKLNLTEVNQDGSSVVFSTNENAKLVITPFSDATVQVWADYKGKNQRDKSYSVDHECSDFMDYTLSDNGNYYLVSTAKCAIRVYKNGVRIEYYKADNITLITADNGAISMGWEDDGKVFLYHKLAKSEHFYGLGEDNDGYLGNLDRRGTTRDMMTGQRINVGQVTADIPITFFMSTGGNAPYGLFCDNSYRMYYNMGKENDDYYYYSANGGELLNYFFVGENFVDILEQYTCLTGKPAMPPLWSLGYAQCKCSYYSWPEIDEIIEMLKRNHIPLDCIVFDYDWDYGYEYEGLKSYEVYAPQNRIPVFAKAGAIIPMAPQTMNTRGLDFKNIVVKLYPYGTSNFTMFTDDGTSYNFQNGDYTITDFTCVEEIGMQTKVTIKRSNQLYAADHYVFDININAFPGLVKQNDKELERTYFKIALEKMDSGYYVDDFNKKLHVKISTTQELEHTLVITHSATPQLVHPKSYKSEEDEVEGQLPFIYPAASIPCRIQGENFDRGGESAAFHKFSAGNPNKIYCEDPVDIVLCDDVGCGNNVEQMIGGEWLEYSVLVRETTGYNFTLRYKSKGQQ